jgi:hypothetical protein
MYSWNVSIGLPEAGVLIGGKLPLRSDGSHRLLLKHYPITVLEIAEHFRGNDEVSAVDPADLGLRLFVEFANGPVLFESKFAEAPWRVHRGERDELAVRFVKRDRLRQIDVPDAVPVGKEKVLILSDVVLDRLRRPAVSVSSPVSASVTLQSSSVCRV